ncbi:MAG: hypothetical protein QJR07_12090 [Acetobacteraceae bacterium]|nr:hypothetical protein [Acetobacteraceae bacterium]
MTRTTTPAPRLLLLPDAPRPRLLLREDLRDAEGQPRFCLSIPGRRLPVAFPTISAALAALRALKVNR